MTHSHWLITPDANNDQAYAILSQDPVWNSFALADLEEPFRAYSQFAIASLDKSSQHAICLILRHPIIGQVLSPFGDEEGISTLLQHLTLPEHTLLQVQETHLHTLQHYYQPETIWKKMLRMAITPDVWQPPQYVPQQSVKQLTTSDLPALKKLYTPYPEMGFSAELFVQRLYFGVYEGEQIIAAGGTHALIPEHHIAIPGNIVTAPEARGRGFATAITNALVATLFKRHYTLVVLNVFEDNTQAIRVYQRLGFQLRHKYLTGKAHLLR